MHWECSINARKCRESTQMNSKYMISKVSKCQTQRSVKSSANSCFLWNHFLLTSKIMHVPNCQQLWIGGSENMTSTFFCYWMKFQSLLLHLVFDLLLYKYIEEDAQGPRRGRKKQKIRIQWQKPDYLPMPLLDLKSQSHFQEKWSIPAEDFCVVQQAKDFSHQA